MDSFGSARRPRPEESSSSESTVLRQTPSSSFVVKEHDFRNIETASWLYPIASAISC